MANLLANLKRLNRLILIWIALTYPRHHNHEAETASWAGNSPNVIHRHYKALVKETDAKEFWEITPQNVKSKIAKLPDQAAAAA